MVQLFWSARASRFMSVALAAMLVLGLSLVVEPRTALAAGTVGSGTPASCDEAALDVALTGGGSLDFDCGAAPHTITITVTKVISTDTAIDGGGLITISGGNSVRVMIVSPGASLTLQDITLTEGKSPVDTFNGEFGLGGAIRNNGTLTLENVTVANSVATSVGCPSACTGEGGGIFNSGTLTATGSTISGNAGSSGGGIYNRGTVNLTDSIVSGNRGGSSGGGIYNDNATVSLIRTLVDNNSGYGSAGGIMNLGASLTIVDSTISNNSVDVFDGGGIDNLSGLVNISGSTISGNSVPNDGGGIYSTASGSSSVTIVDSTLSGNSAGRNGGGIISGAILSMTNSTVSGNSAPNGGGVYNFRLSGIAFPPASEATLTHVTITNNTSGNGAGLRRTGGLVELTGTLIAGNNGADCVQGSIFSGLETDSLGHNLEGDGTCPFDQPTDLLNASANLGPLADNGGDTLTHTLLASSAAYNAGAADCGLAADQRGTSRPQGTACDIGAVEVVNAPPSLNTVSANPESVDEGDASLVTAAATDPVDADDDSLSYSFDCDGDGIYEVGPQPGNSYSCAFPDDAGGGASTNVTVNVLVSDPFGETDTGTANVTVNNVDPAFSGLYGDKIDENAFASVGGTIVDPGDLDTFALSIDWGDGSPVEITLLSAAGSFISLHQYLDGTNDYTVTFTVTDNDGGSNTETMAVTVDNVAPTVVLGTDITINEGEPFSAAGSFSDPGTLDAHTATVDYGDGLGEQPLALNPDKTFSLSNNYPADDGQYTVEVCVADDEDEECDKLEVTMLNVPPAIDDVVTTVGANAVTLDVFASDPAGPNDPLSYAFDCDGDGAYEVGPQASNSAGCPTDPISLTLQIGVRVSDGDGGEDQQIVTLALSQTYCANRYTGQLSLPRQGACAGANRTIVIGGSSTTTFCASLPTGALHHQPAGCPAGWRTYVVPGAEPIHACASLWTGELRVTFNGDCGAYEVHHYIPAA